MSELETLDQRFPTGMVMPFLRGDDSKEALEAAFRWMYVHYAAKAYGQFLKTGPCFAIGPFAIDGEGRVLKQEELRNANTCGLMVSFLPTAGKCLEAVIPEIWIRKSITDRLEHYNPEMELGVLLLREGNPHTFVLMNNDQAGPSDLWDRFHGDIEAEEGRRPN